LELERRFIERKDFPAARRGYDPVEVEHHLRQVADGVEELKRSTPASDSSSVATATAEQVRGIVEAAERSAAEIRSKVEREADEMRRGADHDAGTTRQRAGAEAAAHVERVEQVTSKLLERTRAIESELDRLVGDLQGSVGSLIETVRGGVDSLSARLEQMKSELSQVGAGTITHGEPAVVRPVDAAPDLAAEVQETAAEAVPDEAKAAEAVPDQAVPDEAKAAEAVPDEAKAAEAVPDEAKAGQPEATREPSEAVEPGVAEEPAVGQGATPVAEAARLIALNMALNGTPRNETRRFLKSKFYLDDPEAILEEVYARVGHSASPSDD
jgi:DivIVA domain-containing protein